MNRSWFGFLYCAAVQMLCGAAVAEQQVIPVWLNKAPGSESWTHHEIEFFQKPLPVAPPMPMIRNVVKPTLTVYPAAPAKRTGTAVIVCPGGGGVILDWKNEGTNIGEWLASRGVTAFILKYRLAPTPDDPAEFEKFMRAHADESWKMGLALGTADARQAIKVVRRRAAEWGVDPDRLGFMGISMGAFVTTRVVLDHDLESRPSFAAAIYGGETAGHPVPSDAPPLFAVVAQDDELGMAGKVVNLYSDWNAAKVPAELHVFAKGGHGFGTIKQGLPVDHWLELFIDWLDSQHGR